MDRTGIEAAFDAAGLSRLKKDIDSLARSSIRLTTSTVDEATLAVGGSKLGGLPDLPAGIAWPQWHGVPQSFIAQIRLADVQSYASALPKTGMLWFFYDAGQQTFGEDVHDRGGWSVIYNNKSSDTTLKRFPAPAGLPAESQFHACNISFGVEETLSLQPQLEITKFDWSEEEQKGYEQLLATFPSKADHAAIHNRLLGNPDTLQDDMRQQCQLISHGVTDANDPRAKELMKGIHDWRLLLQIDSDEHAGMQWANTGLLYYWITQADLEACQFETTWLVLQSE